MVPINHDVKDFLTRLGLTKTEISLYVTGLQVGPQTVAELAKRAAVKRTTAHSALASLIERGLFGVHSQTGVSYYTATDPNLIEHTFDEQIDELKKQRLDFINLLPLLEDMSASAATSTEVASYQGEAGVRTAVDAALYCASRKWKIIAPERNFFSENTKEYADYFIRIRTQRKIRAQSLWEKDFIKKRKFYDIDFEFRNPRMLPNSLTGKFKNTLIIFDASVLFVSSAKEQSAVLIRSKEITDTMNVFFDGLWTNAQAIPKRYIKSRAG